MNTKKEDMPLPLSGLEWDGTVLRTDDPALRKKADRKWMSYSVMGSVTKCLASHVGEQNLPWIADPLSPSELGTAAHVILEDFYQLPPAERKMDAAMHLVDVKAAQQWDVKLLTDRDELTLKANAELRAKWEEKVRLFVGNIFKMEDPTHVDVVGTEYNLRGVELELTGGAIVGQIDRVDREADGTITVSDYKSGKAQLNPSPRFADSHSDQLHLYYAGYAKETGVKPSHAKVLYIAEAKTRVIELTDSKAEAIQNKMGYARALLAEATSTGIYPATPSALCAWCKLAKSCPIPLVKTEKARAQFALLPESEQLGIGTYAAPVSMSAVLATPDINSLEEQTKKKEGPNMTTPVIPRPEAPAYDEMVGTGLNLNSFAAIAVNDTVTFATGHLDIHGQPLTESTITEMSKVIAFIVQSVEFQLGQQTSWQRGVNARARSLVKQAVMTKPAPFGGSVEAWQAWIDRAVTMSIVMFKASIAVYQNDNTLTLPDLALIQSLTVPSTKEIV